MHVKRFTGNERAVLKILLKNSKTSDVDIGNKLKITSQAISKIKRKLISMGVIRNYLVSLDYGKLGINTFALVLLEMSPEGLEKNYENKLMLENLIGFYRIFKSDSTHIALFGFRSLEELDNYFDCLYLEHSNYVKIKNIYIFPIQGLLKYSYQDLFYNIIKELGKENVPELPPLDYHLEDKKKVKVDNIANNEKKVLKFLIKNEKISHKKSASELNNFDITSRGIGKIKKRLEDRGVIKNYSINLDYEKLGINIFSFIFLNKKPGYWKLKEGMYKFANKCYNVIGCYKLNENSLHVLFCGFSNLEGLEKYCYRLQSQNKDLFEISKIYILSNSGILKDSPSDLFNSILR